MTLAGTNTWLLSHGAGSYVVIDPGPMMHEEQIMSLTGGRVSAIMLTHRHGNASACAAVLAARSLAPVYAMDPKFASDNKGILRSGQVLKFDELMVLVMATSGHTSDSVAFLVTSDDEIALLTGDTILGDGASITTFSDGDIGAYLRSLDSLEYLVRRQTKQVPLLPGHGDAHNDSLGLINKYRTNRLQRLAQIRVAVDQGVTDIERIVDLVYKDVPDEVRPAAIMSVEAQLAYLNENG